jgi:hypothetical protein
MKVIVKYDKERWYQSELPGSLIITKAETIHGSQLTEINHVRQQQIHTCSQLGSIYEQSPFKLGRI